MRSVEYMSEVFICRGGSGSGSGKPYPGAEKVLQTYLITADQDWVVPNDIINNELFVRVIGGGGGYYNPYCCGGGGGWMNNATIKVGAGSVVPIKIGIGGGNYQTGGTTSFGTFISALGGSPASGTSGGSGGAGGYSYNAQGGKGYQFGGGAGSWRGGNGGVWGGGGAPSGDGGYYGGGAGGGGDNINANAGNGGYYGGGGGAYNNYGIGGWYNDNGIWKQSGFGGNGGSNQKRTEPENGVNTIGWTNVEKDTNLNRFLTGNGEKGTTTIYRYNMDNLYNVNFCLGGGGGFGGDGGDGAYGNVGTYSDCCTGGGGGGYGSKGGYGDVRNAYQSYHNNTIGGGGGFGGGGGSGDYMSWKSGMYVTYDFINGSGGGYCCSGRYGGGGGYYDGGYYGGGGAYLIDKSLGGGVYGSKNYDGNMKYENGKKWWLFNSILSMVINSNKGMII